MTYKHVGILGVSAEGAALCYRTFCQEAARRAGDNHHPEVSMHTYDLGMLMELTDKGEWDEIGNWLCASAAKLASIGAEILICPDNTVHQALDLVLDRLPLPFLHIAAVVADESARHGYHRVGLTGTRWLMEGPVYPPQFQARGIQCVVPSADHRVGIHRIITSELLYGIVTSESLGYLQQVVSDLEADGCDAVALSCTELPIILNNGNSPLPVLDSTRLLARAAVAAAMDGSGE